MVVGAIVVGAIVVGAIVVGAIVVVVVGAIVGTIVIGTTAMPAFFHNAVVEPSVFLFVFTLEATIVFCFSC
jgi:hypothetical protein